MDEGAALIARLGLGPHPEGGHYRQTWAGPMVGGRASGTAILFLLRAGEASRWHRVDADEIWLWHAGAPLALRIGGREVVMGPRVLEGEEVQAIVPAQVWQTARPLGPWALMSCTVSPGFRFAGFEMAPPGFDVALDEP